MWRLGRLAKCVSEDAPYDEFGVALGIEFGIEFATIYFLDNFVRPSIVSVRVSFGEHIKIKIVSLFASSVLYFLG